MSSDEYAFLDDSDDDGTAERVRNIEDILQKADNYGLLGDVVEVAMDKKSQFPEMDNDELIKRVSMDFDI